MHRHDEKSISKTKFSVTSPKNFEDLLESLGGFGYFQALVIFLYLIFEIPTAFAIFIPIFVGQLPELWLCNNETISSSEVCGCNGTIHSDTYDSIISEWNLICSNAWISDFITTIQMLGLLVGSIIGSQIADWYGRKSGFLLSIILMMLGGAVSACSVNPYMYAVSRFTTGAGIQCFINVTGAGVMEFMPPKFRSLANCIGPLGEGIMLLSVIAYYIRPWRDLYWFTTIPLIAIVLIYPFIPESPRWLLKCNKFDEACAILDYVASVNGKPKIDVNVLKLIADNEKISSNAESPGYLSFIKDKKLRITSLFVMAIWFSWSITYYGVSFNVRNLDGHLYVNVFFKGVANALGQRGALLTNDSLGRRWSLFSAMCCGAIPMVIAAILYLPLGIEIPGVVILVLCLLTLFGMSATRSISKLVTGESFPTSLRAMSFGVSGIAITVGGMLAPQLALLGSFVPSAPFFIFAVVSVGGSLVSFLMKETMGKNLDEEDEEKNENA